MIEFFNNDTNSFEEVASDPESFNEDSIITQVLSPRHFDGESVQARIGWFQTGFTLNFPWEIRLDHVAWERLSP